jgi:hypothetical protein
MTIGQRLQLQPLKRGRRVSPYLQPRLDESYHTISESRRLRWIEQSIRGLDAKVMGHVDDVQDDGGVNDVLTDDEVEKAEWSRVGRRSSRYDEERRREDESE